MRPAREQDWRSLDRAEVERRQAARLRDFLERQVLPYARHYRELFRTHGLQPDRIRSLDDLRRVPFTTKSDLLGGDARAQATRDFVLAPDEADLRRRPDTVLRALLRGRAAAREALLAEYRPVFLTSTTGRSSEPVPFLYTQYDLDNLGFAGRRVVGVMRAKPDERLLNTFPYAPHLAFWLTHYAGLASHLFCVGSGGGKVMGTEGNLRLMLRIKPTALVGMPTFLYHLLRHAVEESRRHDLLHTLILGGEKVPDGMRQKLRQLCADLGSQDVHVLATYGFTEARLAWGECPYPEHRGPSGYHLTPELAIVEVVDPDTGDPVAEGEPGEIVFTALDGRGSVVLRYRTGDVIDGGLVWEPCPHCGSRLPRLAGNISRRSDVGEIELQKLKGTVVDFNVLERTLDDTVTIGAWLLELRKVADDPLEVDELILYAEKLAPRDDAALAREINERFEAATELRLAKVVFCLPGELRVLQGVGTEMKAKRIVDHRPKDGRPAPPRPEVQPAPEPLSAGLRKETP